MNIRPILSSIAVLTALFAVSAPAQEAAAPAATPASSSAPQGATLDTKRANILKKLDAQILVIEDVKSCVRAAKSGSDLGICHNNLEKGRKESKMCSE